MREEGGGSQAGRMPVCLRPRYSIRVLFSECELLPRTVKLSKTSNTFIGKWGQDSPTIGATAWSFSSTRSTFHER